MGDREIEDALVEQRHEARRRGGRQDHRRLQHLSVGLHDTQERLAHHAFAGPRGDDGLEREPHPALVQRRDDLGGEIAGAKPVLVRDRRGIVKIEARPLRRAVERRLGIEQQGMDAAAVARSQDAADARPRRQATRRRLEPGG